MLGQGVPAGLRHFKCTFPHNMHFTCKCSPKALLAQRPRAFRLCRLTQSAGGVPLSLDYATLQLRLQLQEQLHYSTLHYPKLPYITLHYITTLHYPTLHHNYHNYHCNYNYTSLHFLHFTTTTAPLHYNYNYSCITPHYIQQL